MTITYANVTGDRSNCLYPNTLIIDEDTLVKDVAAALSRDYTCSVFSGNYRSNSNFEYADALGMDMDNDFSDEPKDWIRPEDIRNYFPDVKHIIHYSRNNMKEKNGKSPRPKFHIIFEIERTTSASQYALLKQKLLAYFPFFDSNCKDSARFFFGVPDPTVEIHYGNLNLTDFLNDKDILIVTDAPQSNVPIPQGRRNSELYSIAVKLQIRYGNTSESRQKFVEESNRCVPPLTHGELNGIWESARKFASEVQKRPTYVPPELYNMPNKYQPDDYTHLGEARVLADNYRNTMRYSAATGYIVFNGTYWECSETKARAKMHELTQLQLNEALKYHDDKDEYAKFANSMRFSANISSVMKECAPMVEISPDELDRNGYLLCTPAGTVDLTFGLESMRENRASDYITKSTLVSPGTMGEEIWNDFLQTIFCGNEELKLYVQKLCGIAAVGKIALEALIISVGCGRNGKSSFFNSLRTVLGTYADTMASDVLIRDCKRNIYPELAELQGKRLIVAAETAENARLNEVIVKQMCSSDFIRAERKYHAPFSYRPSHTIVLFTNFLPKVGSSDSGIWRRLKVVPFDAVIDSDSDIRNYSEFLVDNAGPAILSWVIEGAVMAIREDFKIQEPDCVLQAIDEYKSDNDWFNMFVMERCEIGDDYQESSSKLYQSYRVWSEAMGEKSHSTKDFYKQLENADFHRITSKNQRVINGIRLKADISDA